MKFFWNNVLFTEDIENLEYNSSVWSFHGDAKSTSLHALMLIKGAYNLLDFDEPNGDLYFCKGNPKKRKANPDGSIDDLVDKIPFGDVVKDNPDGSVDIICPKGHAMLIAGDIYKQYDKTGVLQTFNKKELPVKINKIEGGYTEYLVNHEKIESYENFPSIINGTAVISRRNAYDIEAHYPKYIKNIFAINYYDVKNTYSTNISQNYINIDVVEEIKEDGCTVDGIYKVTLVNGVENDLENIKYIKNMISNIDIDTINIDRIIPNELEKNFNDLITNAKSVGVIKINEFKADRDYQQFLKQIDKGIYNNVKIDIGELRIYIDDDEIPSIRMSNYVQTFISDDTFENKFKTFINLKTFIKEVENKLKSGNVIYDDSMWASKNWLKLVDEDKKFVGEVDLIIKRANGDTTFVSKILKLKGK